MAWLYVIGADWDGDLKIGVSSDPDARLAAFNDMHPRTLELLFLREMEDAYSVEAHVHRCLDHARLNGEWFDGALVTERDVSRAIDSWPGNARVRPEADDYTKEAQKWARELVDLFRYREKISTDAAQGSVAVLAGVGTSTIWRLLYRPFKRISAADYFAVKAAYEIGRRLPNEPTDEPKGGDKE